MRSSIHCTWYGCGFACRAQLSARRCSVCIAVSRREIFLCLHDQRYLKLQTSLICCLLRIKYNEEIALGLQNNLELPKLHAAPLARHNSQQQRVKTDHQPLK